MTESYRVHIYHHYVTFSLIKSLMFKRSNKLWFICLRKSYVRWNYSVHIRVSIFIFSYQIHKIGKLQSLIGILHILFEFKYDWKFLPWIEKLRRYIIRPIRYSNKFIFSFLKLKGIGRSILDCNDWKIKGVTQFSIIFHNRSRFEHFLNLCGLVWKSCS
jgi:hypothetical protein